MTTTKYKSQIIIIFALMLILMIAVAAIFGVVSANSAKTAYFKTAAAAVESIQTSVANYSKDAEFKLGQISSATVVPNGFNAVASVDASGYTEYRTELDVKTYTTATELLNGKEGVSFGVISAFLPSVNDTGKYLIAIRKNGEGWLLLFKKLDVIKTSISTFSFSNIMLVKADGAIVYSFSSASQPQTLLNSVSSSVQEKFLSGKAETVEGSFNNESVLMAFSAKNQSLSVRVVGLIPKATYNDEISQQVLYYSVSAVVLVLIAAACTMFSFLIYKRRNDTLINAAPINNLAFVINRQGKVLKMSRAMRIQFEMSNLAPYIMNERENLTDLLVSCNPVFVEIKDKSGEQRYLTFTVLRHPLGFRLLGNDMTDFMSEYKRLKHEDLVEPDTGFRYAKDLDNSLQKQLGCSSGFHGLMAQVRAVNVNNYRTMLGEHMQRPIMHAWSLALRQTIGKYGKIYILENYDVLLFCNEQEKGLKLLNNIGSVIEPLLRPIKINENYIQLDTRLGFVQVDTDKPNAVNLDNLLCNTSLALKGALESTRATYYILRSSNFNLKRTNFTQAGMVKKMMDEGEVDVFFQPQVGLQKKKIVGFEALCRITSEKSKEISVSEFISTAEQYGGMIELGRFVYEKAMDFATALKGTGVTVAVNVSPIQLMQMGFVDTFLEAFRKRKIDKDTLAIEITEGTMVNSFKETEAKLNILRANGIATHIDDFGVAYSSMLYLKELPITTIKIDKSLIDDVAVNKGNTAIVKNIINLSKDLKLECIAEGVETEKQMAILESLNCDTVQGFLTGRAVPKEQALALVRSKK